MGIGSTVKNMLSGDVPDENPELNNTYGTTETEAGERLHLTNSRRAQKLPPGRGVGTSGRGGDPATYATDNITSNVPGHWQETSAAPPSPPGTGTMFSKKKTDKNTLSKQPSHHQTAEQAQTSQRAHRASEAMVQDDIERSKAYGISGYGTDAAAAAGGSLNTTHQRASGVDQGGSYDSSYGGSTSQREAGGIQNFGDRNTTTSYTTSTVQPTRETYVSSGSPTRTTHIRETHTTGHTRNTDRDAMPSGKTQEDTNQLEPVTHERVRHLETEEIGRLTEHERHVHHIQHHTQPILASEELAEQRTEVTQPVTHISETHVNKEEDKTLFEGQVHQHHDSLSHAAKERTVVDKGNTVHETVHHHVHHVIQPVIEKETIEKRRIHTTIPVHEVTHEAPVVHQSQAHAPIPMEHFIQKGGTLEGSISQDRIGEKILHHGTCTRDVEGMAEDLNKNLKLGEQTTTTTTTTSTTREELSGEKLAAKKAAERIAQTTQATTARTQTFPKN